MSTGAILPVIARNWGFAKPSHLKKLVVGEATVLRDAQVWDAETVEKAPSFAEIREPMDADLQSAFDVAREFTELDDFDAAVALVEKNQDLLERALQQVEHESDESKQAFFSALDTLRTPSIPKNVMRDVDDLLGSAADLEKLDSSTPVGSPDWEKLKKYSVFPKRIDEAKKTHQLLQSEIDAGVAPPADPKNDWLRRYVEMDFHAQKKEAKGAVKTLEDLDLIMDQLEEFVERMPDMLMTDFFEKNPDFVTMMAEMKEWDWYVPPEMPFDNEGHEKYKKGSFDAIERWGKQMTENRTAVINDLLAGKQDPAQLIEYEYRDIINSHDGDWTERQDK
mmetsp:Transcript_16803/g.25095  ORF Transcript_16803/g.25095 Transcript_16803/m.25095 type:complete len:336 (+) Transcript_16803:57-1064(+)|eukprot:CAMPEP_0201554206 /NCGR_PEP_ID=MMETSP0173_2-20130828/38850_1 /ASSEMBLY_ACC=CAM_ASM_000268 /TAXON_ID=218659 /ORGANISM="Vexillifera sp., Strain DIVA3 564/2" /LENGTH=335 /DNA_ID=CAMNT_0047965403 /DNA_START=11 /DNA_END=1018 /DNA_ORIENTATION=+